MSDITLAADAGTEGQSMLKAQAAGSRQVGATILAGQPCYIDANGVIQLAISTAQYVTGSMAQSKFDGVLANDQISGSYATLYGRGVNVRIADSGLTIGGAIWVSNTAGKWADAKVATNDTPVAHVVSATSIVLERGV